MKLPYIVLISCFCLGLFGCKKSKDKDNNSAKAQLLKAGKWQITASIATLNYGGKDTTIDHYSTWRSCEQDDLIEFSSNGKGVKDENSDKCAEDNQSDNFTWELISDDTQLKFTLDNNKVFSNGSRTMVSDLMEITNTQLKLKTTDNIDSKPAVIIETYKNIK
jgi:hypothetical protein